MSKKVEMPEFLKENNGMTDEEKIALLDIATSLALDLPSKNNLNSPDYNKYGNDYFATLDLLAPQYALCSEFERKVKMVLDEINAILRNGFVYSPDDDVNQKIIKSHLLKFIEDNFLISSNGIQTDNRSFFNQSNFEDRKSILINTMLYIKYKSKDLNTRFFSTLKKSYEQNGMINYIENIFKADESTIDQSEKKNNSLRSALQNLLDHPRKHLNFGNEEVNDDILSVLEQFTCEEKLIFFKYAKAFYEREWEKAYLEQILFELSGKKKLKDREYPEYIFRAGPYDGTNITARNVHNNVEAHYHIAYGSNSSDFQTPYISTTTNPLVMANYLYSYGKQGKNKSDNKNPSVDYNMSAIPMIIDTNVIILLAEKRLESLNSELEPLPSEIELLEKIQEKLKVQSKVNSKAISVIATKLQCLVKRVEENNVEYSRDSSLPTDIFDARFPKFMENVSKLKILVAESECVKFFKIYERSKKTGKASKFGPPSAEILFKGSIPEEAIIPLDRLTFDMYHAAMPLPLKSVKMAIQDKIKEQKEYNERLRIFREFLLKLKSRDDYKEFIEQFIDDEFSELEKRFIDEFYFCEVEDNNDGEKKDWKKILNELNLEWKDGKEDEFHQTTGVDIIFQALRNSCCEKMMNNLLERFNQEYAILIQFHDSPDIIQTIKEQLEIKKSLMEVYFSMYPFESIDDATPWFCRLDYLAAFDSRFSVIPPRSKKTYAPHEKSKYNLSWKIWGEDADILLGVNADEKKDKGGIALGTGISQDRDGNYVVSYDIVFKKTIQKATNMLVCEPKTDSKEVAESSLEVSVSSDGYSYDSETAAKSLSVTMKAREELEESEKIEIKMTRKSDEKTIIKTEKEVGETDKVI